ncbi:RNA polymerase sigma factor [Aneurinibacillus tyrosinisolvens]|uniref:RNA polymerase sigma factor n=1 Tax=Aneurinibacillus tyrosinisolvens TaxID=1443435 RepID=UPI00063F9488|nr:RNA polymerase sigma factor [Aneurinibacillus tyrosinisolvens]
MNEELYTLIREAKRGNKEAFVQLIRRYNGAVFRQAYAMLHDRMEAEDVSQEVFLKVHSSLAKLENEYAFTSWLTRIVFRLCYDRIEKKKKEKVIFTEGLEENIPSSFGESVEYKHMQLSIEEAMQKLSPEHRSVIVLRDIQGFSYDEMADMLQIPVGTIKSRLHTARLTLRSELTSGERGECM